MSKRPETFDDLPSWEKADTLAWLEAPDAAIKCGVFGAVQAAIDVYAAVHGDAAIEVMCEHNRVTIQRPYTEVELAAMLAEAQQKWDERHGGGS